MSQSAPSTSEPTADHLCVLVHGLWGNPNHLQNVVKVLQEKHSKEYLHILVAKRNIGSFTYDGIELGGERVCQEIEEEIEALERRGQTIKKLSIVGYSLGGLIARYAVGLLYSRGVFEKVEPINLSTFASPHLGVRTPTRGWHNHIWNVLGARTLSMSGRQLFMIDKFRDTDRPLLAVLADPRSIFIKGLALFKRRTLYSNIVNDRSAVYYTTGISKVDPFVSLDTVNVNYLKGTEEVLIDVKHPVSPKPKEEVPPKWYRTIISDIQSMLRSLPLFLGLVIFIPVGMVAFLVNSGIQTFTSSRRIRLHEAGRAGIRINSYRTPLMLTGMRGAVEGAYENLNSSNENEYLDSAAEEEEALTSPIPDSPQFKKAKGPSDTNQRAEKTILEGVSDEIRVPSADEEMEVGNVKFPILALTPDQFAMVQALDEVGWNKYPVHIHKVRHSHAAIIVRSNRKSLSEGYIVMKHWVDKEFLMK